jgi:hypothetical protein
LTMKSCLSCSRRLQSMVTIAIHRSCRQLVVLKLVSGRQRLRKLVQRRPRSTMIGFQQRLCAQF